MDGIIQNPAEASSQEFVRTNGFQFPLNMYQILSWGVFLLEILTTVLIFIPPLSLPLKIVIGILVLLLMGVTCYYAYLATIANPTDPTVIEEKRCKERGAIFQTKLKHFCVVCNAHVLARTKHCGQCNRCVDVFDHHCIWLNNCIGSKNYKYFLKTIIALWIETDIKLGFGIYLLVRFYVSRNSFDLESFKFYNNPVNGTMIHAMTIVSCVINLALWVFLGRLIILHFWLSRQNLTTYEWIIRKRQGGIPEIAQSLERPRRTQKSRVIRDLEVDGESVDASMDIPGRNQSTQQDIQVIEHKKKRNRKINIKVDNGEDKSGMNNSSSYMSTNRPAFQSGNSGRHEKTNSIGIKAETSMSMLLTKVDPNSQMYSSSRERPQDSLEEEEKHDDPKNNVGRILPIPDTEEKTLHGDQQTDFTPMTTTLVSETSHPLKQEKEREKRIRTSQKGQRKKLAIQKEYMKHAESLVKLSPVTSPSDLEKTKESKMRDGSVDHEQGEILRMLKDSPLKMIESVQREVRSKSILEEKSNISHLAETQEGFQISPSKFSSLKSIEKTEADN